MLSTSGRKYNYTMLLTSIIGFNVPWRIGYTSLKINSFCQESLNERNLKTPPPNKSQKHQYQISINQEAMHIIKRQAIRVIVRYLEPNKTLWYVNREYSNKKIHAEKLHLVNSPINDTRHVLSLSKRLPISVTPIKIRKRRRRLWRQRPSWNRVHLVNTIIFFRTG